MGRPITTQLATGPDAVTLGEHLARLGQGDGTVQQARPRRPSWIRRAGYGLANLGLWMAALALAWFWAATGFVGDVTLAGAALGLCVIWVALALRRRRHIRSGGETHFLLAGDTQGFMASLRRDAKTAVIDGNNLYHFGLSERLGGVVLSRIARQLRAEGYRIVCFFDANIFYTLTDNADYPQGQRHELSRLGAFFGLAPSEVYVVPSGVQADRYILSTLRHMPISFAITNDRFRDYAKPYAEVMTGDQWRKGVSVSGDQIKLYKFRFETPVRVTAKDLT